MGMFNEIKAYMQRIDGNGDWENAERDEVSYMYEVMNQWIDDGMTVTTRVEFYMLALERMIMDDGKRS